MTQNGFNPYLEFHPAEGGPQPRVRWRSGYRVVRLATPGEPLTLPGKDDLLTERAIRETENALVLGEGSGGVRDLLEWWAAKLSKPLAAPWIIAHGGSWSELFLRSSWGDRKRAPAAERDRAATLVQLTAGLASLTSSSAVAKRLIELDGAVRKPFWLIIRNIEGLGPEASKRLAEAFVLVRDHRKCPNLRLVVGSSSDELFFTDDLWSGFLRFQNVYRVASFGVGEVEVLAGAWRKGRPDPGDDRDGRLQLPREVAEQVVEFTGGQPLLVQTFLGRLAAQAAQMKRGSTREAGDLDVEKAFEDLRRSPPEVAKTWQRDLERILESDASLIAAIRSYASGHTKGPSRFPLDTHERPLHIGGWVRLNRRGRWGIASRLHQDLAGPVLDKVERRR